MPKLRGEVGKDVAFVSPVRLQRRRGREGEKREERDMASSPWARILKKRRRRGNTSTPFLCRKSKRRRGGGKRGLLHGLQIPKRKKGRKEDLRYYYYLYSPDRRRGERRGKKKGKRGGPSGRPSHVKKRSLPALLQS